MTFPSAALEGVAALDKWYLAELPLSIQVWLKVLQVKAPGQRPMGRPLLLRMRLRLKKAPALTLAQVHQSVGIALPLKHLSVEEAIEIIRYHQQRNYAAYQAHRKRTLKEHRARTSDARKT